MPPESDPESLRRLEPAVADLPELQRRIFLAHRLDGLSYQQIAGRLGLTVDEVERRFAKALRKIGRQLRGQRLRWWERWF